MPGRWIASGSRLPVGTISSTSMMQTLPHMAAGGLKLRGSLAEDRIAVSSAFHALTMERSAKIPRSRIYSSPSKTFHLLALGDDGAHARLGVEAGDARAARRACAPASVPCGLNSSSSSPDRYCRMNSAFSPT